MRLATLIEGLLFVAEQPISLSEITEICLSADPETTIEIVEKNIELLKIQYQSENYAFNIVKIAEGYQLLTKSELTPYLRKILVHKEQRKVSKAMLDVLAIIAYKQPITKPEIELIRGVNCDYALSKLLEKNLIEISGRAEAPGRPLLYQTSNIFLQHFGINNLSELPKISELPELSPTKIIEYNPDKLPNN
ncbi:MAG: SMC-Scp complex subunit ScpB [Bacteroidia bacterium]|nr:SMC-Scp complex subunit ScpB [Bacteroidia bacterium]